MNLTQDVEVLCDKNYKTKKKQKTLRDGETGHVPKLTGSA